MKLKLLIILFSIWSTNLVASPTYGKFVTGRTCSGLDFYSNRMVNNLTFGSNEFRDGWGQRVISKNDYIFIFGRLAKELTDLELYPSQIGPGDGDGLYYNLASFWQNSGHYGAIIRNDQRKVFFYYVKPQAYGVNLEIWNQDHSTLIYEKYFSECRNN
ncbi:MAG: hypothetical protein EP319_01425 [Deltaproteobacteria bacterium]|nr:MAG: hypothetical protein EP319_01425 [Deltaproteobacteria bacterium]